MAAAAPVLSGAADRDTTADRTAITSMELPTRQPQLGFQVPLARKSSTL
jgi:hypothetical protein